MRKPTLSDRLRYAFDNTLSRGPIALIGWLGVAATLLVTIATLVDLAIGGVDNQAGLGPFQVFWDILSQALTPNPVDPGNPRPFLAVMLVVTLGSLFMVSILIGVLNATISSRIEALRRGRSRVIENNHIVILGWNEQVLAIVAELILANEHQRKSCIVILGDKDKVEMEEVLRETVGHHRHMRIVCRTGFPIDLNDLSIVSLDTARAIIVLGPEHDDPDSSVIKTILAITNNPKRRPEPYHIVAEINDPRNMEPARLVGGDETELVLTGDLIARIIAQSSRQSGLSVVYTELLDFEGDEIYFAEEPALVGQTFGEILSAYRKSTIIGICPASGVPKLNPPMHTQLSAGDQILAISADQDTIKLALADKLPPQTSAINLRDLEAPKPERTLILGWNERAPSIIGQLDSYVASGSEVMVVADRPEVSDSDDWGCPELINQTVQFQIADTTDRRLLNSLAIDSYQHVIVLPYSDTLETQRADARTLITLLHLRDVAARTGHHFSIVSEMLDVRNRTLAEVTEADDFVVSDKLVSLMLSQIAEDKALNAVFTDLFSRSGSDIYLKPAANYIVTGQPLNFYTVVEAARRRGEVALGYRQHALLNDSSQAHGVILNPDKAAPVTFTDADRIIVLAEG